MHGETHRSRRAHLLNIMRMDEKLHPAKNMAQFSPTMGIIPPCF